MTNIELKLTGLTCGHCQAHVIEELEALSGVTAVAVDLHVGGVSTAQVTAEVDICDEALREAIDEAGAYTIEAITRA